MVLRFRLARWLVAYFLSLGSIICRAWCTCCVVELLEFAVTRSFTTLGKQYFVSFCHTIASYSLRQLWHQYGLKNPARVRGGAGIDTGPCAREVHIPWGPVVKKHATLGDAEENKQKLSCLVCLQTRPALKNLRTQKLLQVSRWPKKRGSDWRCQ